MPPPRTITPPPPKELLTIPLKQTSMPILVTQGGLMVLKLVDFTDVIVRRPGSQLTIPITGLSGPETVMDFYLGNLRVALNNKQSHSECLNPVGSAPSC